MKLYRLSICCMGATAFFRRGLSHYVGVTTHARTSKVDAFRKYNEIKIKLKGLPARLRLELVQVPDRLTISEWTSYLESEIFDVQVVEVLREETLKAET